ncbi:unnamed protein product [Lampetra planeri]
MCNFWLASSGLCTGGDGARRLLHLWAPSRPLNATSGRRRSPPPPARVATAVDSMIIVTSWSPPAPPPSAEERRLCRDRGRAAALKRKNGGGGDGGGTEERSVGFRLVATAEQPFSAPRCDMTSQKRALRAARRDLRRAPPRPPECDLRRAVRGMFHETTLK